MSVRFILLIALAFVLWRSSIIIRRMLRNGRRHDGPDPFDAAPPQKPRQSFRDVEDASFEDLSRDTSGKNTPS
jgi:hypothetical protein